MDRLHKAKRLQAKARLLQLMACAVIATAQEISAYTREVCHESRTLLKRIHMSRLHGPLPKDRV